MPLVRVEVRNEYALGAPELYREANKEDPKEILEGVAVAGLIGVLRQLGDLAEFAAEVFHGLQEEVTITSSRSHKLMARVQRIEAALSPLEKAILAQRSHLHFAYTAGSNWHTRIRCEKNHFVYGDVPQFIMDSYEDSRDPPRLHLLDRFDSGGPGSCLKRYSDPTFFKRASVASGEATTEKIPIDKNGHKIKKRRSRTRNGEVSRGASFSYHSGRTHFSQMNAGGHNSPTPTTSTYDTTLRSDVGTQSNLDLRNGSGYNEADFRPSYSTQPEEQESGVSISSPVKRHDNDFLDFNFLEKKNTVPCDDIQINQLQEQAGCSSSSVTWDEKTETLEPTMQGYDHDSMSQEDDHDINLESFSPKLDPETVGNKPVKFETFDKMDIQFFNEGVPALDSGDVQPEDIESETDDFMDALNTIESESETDVECTRKQDLEHYTKLEDKAVDDGLSELMRPHSDCQSSNSESNVLANSTLTGSCGHDLIEVTPKSPSAAYCSINEVAVKNENNTVSPVDNALLSAQRSRDLLNPGSPCIPQSVDSPENDTIYDATIVESVSTNFSDNISRISDINGTKSSPESKKPAPETANVAPVTFWTNGGLLGLQPSKPPDWSRLNALPEDHVFKKDETISSSSKHLISSDKDVGNPDQTENSKNFEEGPCTDGYQEYQESGISFRRKTSWKISPSDLNVKLGKSSDSLYPNNPSCTGASVMASGSSLPVNSDFQAGRKHEENGRSSSRMFELSNRLLTTGSIKTVLPNGDQNCSPNAFEQNTRQNISYQTISGRTKDLLGVDSLIPSPSSSPPLEHMKISFQPIDGFETSKLKLKFPDGNFNNESSKVIFPSFQLVPEENFIRHNVGSDSDDDTFCKSSPSLSDDCHSHHFESNSEQWESGESPSSKDHDLYDSLRRISLTESVSTVPENESAIRNDINHNSGLQFPPTENSVKNSQSCRSFDLQSLDTLNHSFRELRNDTYLKDLVEPQIAPGPGPPPLPPFQWRSMKPNMDVIGNESEKMPEDSNYVFNYKHSGSTISQQPKAAPFSEDQSFETTKVHKSKKLSSQKSNGHREANQGKIIDEKEDFLHQIRSKSFNLRPIGKAKTNAQSGGSANVQVTAILEKANAIRQAVGSDDGEDDGNWSDT
ncbi:hypothetical protein ACJIZ3_006199 [Penstemon smallii]|uniref:Protein SCAR n=1 Tax=Penstemon smallii TaxID=265156 RepID=A0ABD3S6Z7_9LAMI